MGDVPIVDAVRRARPSRKMACIVGNWLVLAPFWGHCQEMTSRDARGDNIGNRPSRVGFAALVAAVCLISVLHYITSYRSIELHELFQRLYYVPIVTAAVIYGMRGGLALAGLSTVLFLPHVVLKWHAWPVFQLDQYSEVIVFTLVAVATGLLADRLRAERDLCRRTALELDETCQRLEASIDERLKADRLITIGRLASGIAHEIRTPLGGLLGSLEILGAGIAPSDPKCEFLTIAKNEISRLNKTVADFLEFARPAAPVTRPADLRAIVDAVVRLVGPTLVMNGGDVDVEIGADAPRVQVDVVQLERALINILLDESVVRSRVHIGLVEDQPGRAVRLVVSRSLGSGEPNIAADIFEPFSTSDPGAGLTLATARRLIENQGGTIRAECVAGSARYFVELPSAGDAAGSSEGQPDAVAPVVRPTRSV